MLHAAPATLPHNAAAIVRLLSDQNTSGRASWNVIVKKDGTRYRLDYAWRGSGEVSIHVIDGKREEWAATRGSKAQYVCSRTRPGATTCKAHPTVAQAAPVFLAFSWFFDPSYLGKLFAKAKNSSVTHVRQSGFPVACLHDAASATCVTAFGAPTLLVTPQVKLVARSLAAAPRTADFTKPKVTPPSTNNDPALGLYA